MFRRLISISIKSLPSQLSASKYRHCVRLLSSAVIEKDIVLSDNPDQFGTISKDYAVRKELSTIEEEDDIETKEILDDTGRHFLRTKEYADKIKLHLNRNQITDALDVLETTMLKEHRAQPDKYIYNLLISGCARVGYTKKAFNLFNQMKKRGLKVTASTYTSLFNACANSPWPQDGLDRANHLRELILEKGYTPNITNYHAMIKAYGRCGDILSAFNLVDEMKRNEVKISAETFNFLLQACISDKENGFRHALLVWRKIREKKIQPDVFTYNLLLRSIRECGMGSREKYKNEIARITESEDQKLIGEPKTTGSQLIPLEVDCPPTPPNLLAAKPHLGDVLDIKDITEPEHKLMLTGGVQGFLEEMKKDRVKPDEKTITELLGVAPSSLETEALLLKTMESNRILVDTAFCNCLIKKRVMRKDYVAAKDVLNLISSRGITPDMITFGVLGLACKSTQEMRQLLTDIHDAGLRPNTEILGGILKTACLSWDIDMIRSIMKTLEEEKLKPNKIFMRSLNDFQKKVDGEIANLKKPGWLTRKKVKNARFMEAYSEYKVFYKQWKENNPVLDTDSVHPFQQFFKNKKG